MYCQLADIDPGHRESAEESMVETAQRLAAIVETTRAVARSGRDSRSPVFESLYARRFNAEICGVVENRGERRLTVVETAGTVLFDSLNKSVGQNHSQWRDIARCAASTARAPRPMRRMTRRRR